MADPKIEPFSAERLRQIREWARILAAVADAAADADEPDLAIGIIYTEVDALLRADRFDDVDALLRNVSLDAMAVVHLLAFASITYVAKDRLPERRTYMARVRAHLEKAEPSRVEELLAGFE